MKVKVIYSVWGADGFEEPLHGGEHDLEDLTEEQARSVAGGVAGRALELVDATPEDIELLHPHIQSQEDGEAAYAAAQESGRWNHGNLLGFAAAGKDALLYDDIVVSGKGPKGVKPMPVERRLQTEQGVRDAEGALSLLEVPE